MASLCGPCCGGGIKHEALKWCVNCEERLCSGCIQHHLSLKLTRNHQLVDIQLKENNKSTQDELRYAYCPQHPSQEYRFYCTKHYVLLCGDCVAIDYLHHACGREVLPIEAIAGGSKDSPLLMSLKTDISNIGQSFGNMAHDKQKVENDFAGEVTDARKKLSETKFQLQRYLDEMETLALQDLNIKETDTRLRIAADISTSEKYQKLAGQYLLELQNILKSGTDKQAFLLLPMLKLFKEENEERLKDMSYNMNAYSLKTTHTDNSVLIDALSNAFGKFEVTGVPVHVKRTEDMKISTFGITKLMPIDTGKYVQHVSVTDDGRFLLTELNIMSSSKVYTANEHGKFTSEAKLPGLPNDAAAIPGTQRGVILVDEDKILFIDAGKCSYESNVIKMAKNCKCVAANPTSIYVSNQNQIIVMDLNGKFKESIKISRDHVNCMTVENDGTIYFVVDDKVYCLRTFGEESCIYKTKDLKEITGICHDAQGNIYISGRKSNNIHVLKHSTGTAEVLLRKEDGLKKPKGITFDKVRNNLYVYYQNYDPIQAFHID